MLTQSITNQMALDTFAIETPSLPEFVEKQTEINRKRWFDANDSFPTWLRHYSSQEKAANEKRISEQLDWYVKAIEKDQAALADRQYFTEAVGYRLQVLGMNVLGLTHDQISVLGKEGLIDIARDFYHQARQFDASISMSDIFQASRNVWTAGYLQVLLELEVSLTPSIFAYSMLYPVSDNFLDDPRVSRAEKVEFNQRFCSFLKGERGASRNEVEEKVLRLIGMIEVQYPRECYPQVYEGLLAIHCAQDRSMRLPKMPVTPHSVDVLGVTLAKGGTSVLADGILAAGELNAAQMETIFDYGVFAQFMDDQEDVGGDVKNADLTIFSECARSGKLDQAMNRFFSFAKTTLGGMDLFLSDRSAPLIQASFKGIDVLLIDGIMRTSQFYSNEYLKKVETFFPVRFTYMRELRNRIKNKKLTLERTLTPLLRL